MDQDILKIGSNLISWGKWKEKQKVYPVVRRSSTTGACPVVSPVKETASGVVVTRRGKTVTIKDWQPKKR